MRPPPCADAVCRARGTPRPLDRGESACIVRRTSVEPKSENERTACPRVAGRLPASAAPAKAGRRGLRRRRRGFSRCTRTNRSTVVIAATRSRSRLASRLSSAAKACRTSRCGARHAERRRNAPEPSPGHANTTPRSVQTAAARPSSRSHPGPTGPSIAVPASTRFAPAPPPPVRPRPEPSGSKAFARARSCRNRSSPATGAHRRIPGCAADPVQRTRPADFVPVQGRPMIAGRRRAPVQRQHLLPIADLTLTASSTPRTTARTHPTGGTPWA